MDKETEGRAIRRYKCLHCKRLVAVSYLAQHTLREHIEKNYEIIEFVPQAVLFGNDQE